MLRSARVALILCFWTAPAFAHVPDATIERIVELRVDAEDNRAQGNWFQIDHKTFLSRDEAIKAELNTLYDQLRRLPAEDQREVFNRIATLTAARLTILEPQWKARGEKFNREQQQQTMRDARTAVRARDARMEATESTRNSAGKPERDSGSRAALAPQPKTRSAQVGQPPAPRAETVNESSQADVQAAVELRRRRLLLQQRRQRGEISETEFAAEDNKALGDFMAIRNRYARGTGHAAPDFDREVELTFFNVPKNGAVATPASPAASGGTSNTDYQHDVALAAKLMTQRNDLFKQISARHELDAPTLREADKPIFIEWMNLREKWHGAGWGSAFDAAIHERSGLPVAPWPFPERAFHPENAVRVLAPSMGTGLALKIFLALLILILSATAYLVYRLLRGKPARRTRLKNILWYAPIVLVLWLWTAPVGYRFDNKLVGIVVMSEHGYVALGVTALLYLFYRRTRKTAARPASLWGLAWFTPAAVILWFVTTPVFYYSGGAALEIVVRRIFFGLCGLGGLALLARIFGPRAPVQRLLSTIYGSAHYAPLQQDIRDEACLSNGVFLGKSSQPGQAAAPLDAPGAPICTIPERHTLIVARTRTGKGTRVIVPTLLRYGGSALVIDPKGENAAITARARRELLRQEVHILNPWGVLQHIHGPRGLFLTRYNPLDMLDRSDPNAVAVAQALAGAICPVSTDGKDRFWQSSAADVLTAVLLWLADQPGEKKTLGRAREIISLTRRDFKENYLIPMAASEAFKGAIREMAARYIDLADETYSGIMATLGEDTRFLSDPQIKESTASSSFSMHDLATGKTTVYVVIPTERMSTQRTWLRLIVAAAMNVFSNPRGKRKRGHRCLFLIDEFPALGRLDDIPRDIASMCGYGVDFALVVQGLDQLKAHYGDDKATILNNCAYKWFCNVADLESAKYLSETLGKATVETTSTSDSFSSGSSTSSSSHSTTHGETGRLLLTPDEVLNLGKHVAIALQDEGHPLYLRPVDYWRLTEAFAALQQKYPSLYWEPPLYYDENPFIQPAGDDRGAENNDGATTSQRHGESKANDRSPGRNKFPIPSELLDSSNGKSMTPVLAREILSVPPKATRKEIETAADRVVLMINCYGQKLEWFRPYVAEAKRVLLHDLDGK